MFQLEHIAAIEKRLWTAADNLCVNSEYASNEHFLPVMDLVFLRHACWLTERFPDAELCDVAGLVKLVDRAEIEANDWSLTPGRYVGVAPVEEDEDFDFAKTRREIHAEPDELNDEAATLTAKIKKNFEALGL